MTAKILLRAIPRLKNIVASLQGLKPIKFLSARLERALRALAKKAEEISPNRLLYLRVTYHDFFTGNLSRIAKLDKEHKHLSQENLDRMQERKDKFHRSSRRFGAVNSLIIGLLFLSVIKMPTNVRFFGVSIQDIDRIRELLLFISVSLGVVSYSFSITANAIGQYIQRAVQVTFPEKFQEIYEVIYKDHLNILATILLRRPIEFQEQVPSGKIGILTAIWSVLFFLFVSFVLVAAAMIVHVMVVIDILEYPAAPLWINRFVIFYTIICDVSILFFLFVFNYPLRYTNLTFLNKFRKATEAGTTATMRLLDQEMKNIKAQKRRLDA